MKKFICIVLSMTMACSALFAQTADKKEKPAATKKEAAAPADKGGKMKKDGTPDKRYKENKETKAAGPMKKDGTPDMRYKANKDGAAKPAADAKKEDKKAPAKKEASAKKDAPAKK